ncbi:MAG: hypothetical protein PXX77_02420 [Gallionella sp.]|nr:hypothetical protein [Gallionella sp.]
MEALAAILVYSAMLSPLIALAAAIVVYLKFQGAPEGKRRSVILFSFGVLVVGLVAGWFGAAMGIGGFCSPQSGAQCGFAGIFFTGPASFSLAVVAYLYFWVKHGKAP